MPTPAERLATLLEMHDDSLRSAADRCGLDHTTLMRVRGGETENPATLAKIAEGYGVPIGWVRGERDLGTDFGFAVLSRPLSERVLFVREPTRRASVALAFLSEYDPGRYPYSDLASIVELPQADVESIIEGELKPIPTKSLERLCAETGLPMEWFRTGLVGRENVEDMLVGLAEWALSTLADTLGLNLSREEIQEAALALV